MFWPLFVELIWRNREADGRVSSAAGKGRTCQCTAATRRGADGAGANIADPDIV
jgi:hypothetical protein